MQIKSVKKLLFMGAFVEFLLFRFKLAVQYFFSENTRGQFSVLFNPLDLLHFKLPLK